MLDYRIMSILDAFKALARYVLRDPLATWPYDFATLECDRCGIERRMTRDYLESFYGRDADMQDINAAIKKKCHREKCAAFIAEMSIPSHYR